MEGTKYIFVIIFNLFSFFLLGQNNQSIYEAYITGDMKGWEKTMDSFTPKTNNEKLELINYQYGYIGWCIDQDKDQEAREYLRKAETIIDELEKKNYNLSMLFAYKAAFIGFEIGLAPYKAPFIGPESLSFAEQSVSLDSQNAFAYVQLGNIAFYTPKMFGGSRPEAIRHYLKAIEIIEKYDNQLIYNWNYLNLLATIINAYFEMGQYEKAKDLCIKTLSIEPEFDWVKNILYPNLDKPKPNRYE